MGFWMFCLAMVLLIPIIMLVVGWFFCRRPPRRINHLCGYRTARSMKTQATWDFAHKTCGRIWFRVGLVLLPISAAAMVPALGRDVDAVGIWCAVVTLVQVGVLVGCIVPVERALKRTFDDSGRKRQ